MKRKREEEEEEGVSLVQVDGLREIGSEPLQKAWNRETYSDLILYGGGALFRAWLRELLSCQPPEEDVHIILDGTSRQETEQLGKFLYNVDGAPLMAAKNQWAHWLDSTKIADEECTLKYEDDDDREEGGRPQDSVVE